MSIKGENMSLNKNEDDMKLKISSLNRKLDEIKLGGGKKKIEKHRSKGKLFVRDRINLLLDKKKSQELTSNANIFLKDNPKDI